MTCPKSLSESELGLGPILLCLKGLFQAFSQRVFLPLLNMVLPTMKCSPQGLKQMDLDCECAQKTLLVTAIGYGNSNSAASLLG